MTNKFLNNVSKNYWKNVTIIGVISFFSNWD
jgi:hypothetical protein